MAAQQVETGIGPFFVAGTGRSGSSQLMRVLGSHPLVHALTWETRFLIDPGGFEDLARALTETYTPYHAADALRRLSWLLGERLTGRSMEAFRGWGLAGELGERRYYTALDELWRRLAWYEFDEAVPAAGWQLGVTGHLPHEQRANRRVVGRHFAERGELIAILRQFTDGLFGAAAADAGKPTWAEKTPFNLLSIDFLWELFPEATVVVMVRSPRDVVTSHLDQWWAPATVGDVVSWLEPVYRRWLAQRARLLGDPRYVEVRLEDVSLGWPGTRPAVLGRLGLPDADTEGFEHAAVTHRANQLSAADQQLLTERLGWALTELGYR